MRAAETDPAISLFGGVPYGEHQVESLSRFDSKVVESKSQNAAAPEARTIAQVVKNNQNLSINELYLFAAGLERRMHACLLESIPQKAIAQEIILLLKEIVNREVQCFELEDGLDVFDERMLGEPTLTALIEKLWHEAKLVLYGNRSFSSPGLRSKARLEKTAEHFSEILRRYIRRKVSLHELADEMLYDEMSTRLFGLHIKHDQSLFGGSLSGELAGRVPGLTLNFKACVIGSTFQTLWVRLLMRVDHEYVGVQEGWDDWMLSGESFCDGVPSNMQRIGATYPLCINRQSSIIDQGAIFLPYEAMKLSQQKSEVEFELALFNQRGKKLAAHYLDEIIWRPGKRKQFFSCPVPSPHSLELWSRDLVTGDAIQNLSAKKRVADFNENILLDVSLDLTLVKRKGQKIKISYRVLNTSGEQIRILETENAENEGKASLVTELRIEEVAAFFQNLSVQLSLAYSSVPTRAEDLFLEVVVQDSRNKVICGCIEKVEAL